jgi:TRAP-type C4-dicarboxylate transport system permease small subunit
MAVARAAEAAIGRALDRAARILALAGGVVLAAIALVTVVSIAGRALVPLGMAPLKGDFELVAMGCGIAVFLFLPWCQMRRGHAGVDLAVARLPPRARAAFGLLGDACMALAAVVVLWRLWLGFAERLPHGGPGLRAALGMGERPFLPETSFELGIPVWIPYGICLAGAALLAVVSLYCVWRSLNWTLDGAEGRA